MDDLAFVGAATQCRSCTASVPAGAAWCSLCFAPLVEPAAQREPAAATAQPEPQPEPALVDADALELQRLLASAVQDATSGALGAPAPALADPETELWAQAKLNELGASGGAPTSRISLLLSDRRLRRATAFGGMLAVAIAGVLVMAVLGHVV